MRVETNSGGNDVSNMGESRDCYSGGGVIVVGVLMLGCYYVLSNMGESRD